MTHPIWLGRAARPHQAALRKLAALALAVGLVTGCSTAQRTPQHAPDLASSSPSAVTCAQTAALPAPARALRMAAAAQQEWALWGNASIDAEGRLTQSSTYEAEDTPRDGPDALAPWQRVMRYWRAVDPASNRLPYLVRYGAWRPAQRQLLQAELAHAATAPAQEPGFGVAEGAVLSSSAIAALWIAADRVAVIDTPWSAAFISWLAREAGVVDGEFTFSEAHADYARAGYITVGHEAAGARNDRQVLRACPLAHTPPRVGDLVCHARGRAADVDSFDALGAELTADGLGSRGVPMHCDVVVTVDDTGFDAIGGNVLQAVTQRRLAFAAGSRVLDASYQPGYCNSDHPACLDRHLSQQPWSLLLQWR